jgi:hypothetical protein
VDGFMAAGGPARALLNPGGVIRATDENLAALHLLEMALETQVGIPGHQHLGIHRAMRAVTRGATFLHRFMLEDKRAVLRRMTFQAGGVLRFQGGAAAEVRRAFVRRMTFEAAHFAFHDGMAMREIEFAADIGVAGETHGFDGAGVGPGGGRPQFIRAGPTHGKTVRRFDFATGIRVQAARAVTGFATGVQAIGPAAIRFAWSAV